MAPRYPRRVRTFATSRPLRGWVPLLALAWVLGGPVGCASAPSADAGAGAPAESAVVVGGSDVEEAREVDPADHTADSPSASAQESAAERRSRRQFDRFFRFKRFFGRRYRH